MRKVMTRAWEIAREGVKKFGGKAVDYISESLKLAWAEVKKGVKKAVNNISKIRNIVKESIDNSNYRANEWENYGKQRIYINFKGKSDGFVEVVNGVIESVNVGTYEIQENLSELVGQEYVFASQSARNGVCPKCQTYCFGDCL